MGAKEEDEMPGTTVKTLMRFIALDEILMTATVTKEGLYCRKMVHHVLGQMDTDDFLGIVLMSRNPITFLNEFLFPCPVILLRVE